MDRTAKTAAAVAQHVENGIQRAVDNPQRLRRAATIVGAAYERGIIDVEPSDLRRWAAQQAADLPPLTDQQVAVAAKLAAELDAKHARQAGAA